MHLYLGYKNYSSWSLRAWLILQANNIAFDETVLPIFHDDSLVKLANEWQVPKQVPILADQGMIIWDSLSIMEFLADKYPDKNLWPNDVGLRALARSASAEMHSGFMALRSQCPMNCRVKKRISIDEALQQDLDRLAQLWSMFGSHNSKGAKGAAGNFLCGDFSIVDAMYAPIGVRVRGYGLNVSDSFSSWSDQLFDLPAMQTWMQQALGESWSLPQYDKVGATDYG